jgi:UDP-N-acetylmuramoyl-L-alanyl-D-glutamate--2,6-diaminopimelate ligase
LNLHPEHLEAHGSWERYRAAKQILFQACKGIHVVNADDPSAEYFMHFQARKHLTFGIGHGDIQATDVDADAHHAAFRVGDVPVHLRLGGLFNVYNALAAMTVADAYGVVATQSAATLATVHDIAGRMEWVQKEPFGIVVDYAHTPDSLEAVYTTLRSQAKRLICVLGAAGGGRDKWKRPKFGALAEQYCDRIYLTNEDPFDEDPTLIIEDIASGITGPAQHAKVVRELDRRRAIELALADAQEGDAVVITGKGSETSMALAGGRKIPWSDAETVQALLRKRS